MVKLLIMTGTSAATFSPKGATSRAQAAIVLIRSASAW
ncbi:S-layer homology domain-containing protein [Paenibacillus aurantiacus]|uniref:S-layer homology domain-containing protein n=1 Tax=Paenibacillus aurantiacus TaxID=1936118 RepID=A0ABV5KXR4_9BACL